MSVEVKEVKSSEEVALAKLLTSIEHLVTQATDTLVERDFAQTMSAWVQAAETAARGGKVGLSDFCWAQADELLSRLQAQMRACAGTGASGDA